MTEGASFLSITPIRRLPDGPAELTGQTRYKKRELHPDKEQWTKWRGLPLQPSQTEHWTGLIWFCGCGLTTDYSRRIDTLECPGCGKLPAAEETRRSQ